MVKLRSRRRSRKQQRKSRRAGRRSSRSSRRQRGGQGSTEPPAGALVYGPPTPFEDGNIGDPDIVPGVYRGVLKLSTPL